MPLGSLRHDIQLTALLETQIPPQQAKTCNVGTIQVKGGAASAGLDGKSSRRAVSLRHPIRVELQDQPSEHQPIPPKIVDAAHRVTLLKLETLALRELEYGWHENASKHLHALSTQMLELGAENLARSTALEADVVARQGKMSREGQKRLRYGTRSLAVHD